MKRLKKTSLAIVALLLALFAGIFGYLTYLKPDYNTTLQLLTLKAPVEVFYDNHAIPHIYAENEEDLFYAFGYVHAQDRLFQMEILRRLADGRLAEVFGEKAIASDKFFRTLSFRKHAQITLASTYKDPNSPFVKAAKAYIKGINTYIKLGKTPVEFTLTGIPKSEFTLEDMEIIVGYMGYTFVGAFGSEAVSTDISTRLGPDYYKDVLTAWPDSLYKIPVQQANSASKNLAKIANQLNAMQNELAFPPFHGSNGWAISGKKTKSGLPILANDTHIAFSQPSVWYEAHLECPTFKVYGNFLAGTPVPALGHTPFGGWGITMFENDDADFFKESLNPKNPKQVKYQNSWENIEERQEIIKVKDKEALSFVVKKTRHGYLLNDAFDEIKKIQDPIALWWVFHQFPSQHLNVFYNICKAKNPMDMTKAVAPLTSPGLNFMWADTQGNIAWWAAGRLPKRPKHVNPQIILDGSTGLDDPQGWYDFSLNPQIVNPKSGVLYTANNQPDDMGNGLVPGYYVPANRAKRIEELIFTQKNDWTENTVRAVINDVKSTSYPALIKTIFSDITLGELSPQAKAMQAKLLQWDGTHELENIEPTMFYKFLYNIYMLSLSDELGKEVFTSFEHSFNLKRNTANFFSNKKSKWWDNVSTSQIETRKDIFQKAIELTIKDLENQLGQDQSQWKWEKVHSIEHKHPLGILPLLGKWFNVGPIPINGGRETINNLDFHIDSSGTYKVVYGPALRRIIDMGQLKEAKSVNPTGQSGYFMSKYYDDQAQMFAKGGKRPELTDRKAIEKVKIGKSIFKP
jgi:penicillin G amidase